MLCLSWPVEIVFLTPQEKTEHEKNAKKLVSIKRKKEERGGSPGILEDAGTQESMCTSQGNPHENQRTACHPSTFPEGHLVPLSEP